MKDKNNLNKPKFNSYWMYGIIVSVLLGLSMFTDDSNSGLRKTNISEFERFLNNGDIREVSVINKNLARVSLNQNSLEKPEHKGLKSKNFLGQENIKGPHYEFEVGDLELFQRRLEKAEKNDKGQKVAPGLYIYTVEGGEYGAGCGDSSLFKCDEYEYKHIGKFAIVR